MPPVLFGVALIVTFPIVTRFVVFHVCMGNSVRGLTARGDVVVDMADPSPLSCTLSRPVYSRPLSRKGWVLRQANCSIGLALRPSLDMLCHRAYGSLLVSLPSLSLSR